MSLEEKNRQQKGRKLLTLLFWIYIAVLLKFTIFREAFSFDHLLQNGSLNLSLFTAYIPFLRGGFIWLFIYLFVGNIVWFIPLGGYLTWKYPNCSVWKVTAAGLSLSFVIELSQFVFGVGVTELDDLVLNTAGTLIGAIFMRVWQRIAAKRLSAHEKEN
ncbi:MAG: VanZ family protein [Lachnospiraceae bacterium]|nr:VanZ family protein [Lachnospiraceae bacterium]